MIFFTVSELPTYYMVFCHRRTGWRQSAFFLETIPTLHTKSKHSKQKSRAGPCG